ALRQLCTLPPQQSSESGASPTRACDRPMIGQLPGTQQHEEGAAAPDAPSCANAIGGPRSAATPIRAVTCCVQATANEVGKQSSVTSRRLGEVRVTRRIRVIVLCVAVDKPRWIGAACVAGREDHTEPVTSVPGAVRLVAR